MSEGRRAGVGEVAVQGWEMMNVEDGRRNEWDVERRGDYLRERIDELKYK